MSTANGNGHSNGNGNGNGNGNATPFDWLGDCITRHTTLSRTESRGMLRVVLRDCGLQADTVSLSQLAVVVTRALGPALTRVKVAVPEQVCARVLQELQHAHAGAPRGQDAADVFGLMGRR